MEGPVYWVDYEIYDKSSRCFYQTWDMEEPLRFYLGESAVLDLRNPVDCIEYIIREANTNGVFITNILETPNWL